MTLVRFSCCGYWALRVVSKIGPELSRGVMNKVKTPSQVSNSLRQIAHATLSEKLGGDGLTRIPLLSEKELNGEGEGMSRLRVSG